MKPVPRRRFWLELSLAILTCVAGLLTIISPDWIELFFHIDPDQANGSVEWGIVYCLLFLALSLSLLAGREWRNWRKALV